jgi:small subunit ribosomal protein S21
VKTIFILQVCKNYKIIEDMIGVKVKDNESIDRAINRFKKMITRSRVLNEYKERQQFTKPSEERREAMKKSVREQRRRQRDNY